MLKGQGLTQVAGTLVRRSSLRDPAPQLLRYVFWSQAPFAHGPSFKGILSEVELNRNDDMHVRQVTYLLTSRIPLVINLILVPVSGVY